MRKEQTGALSGVTVLDFTRAVAGAYTTRLLCDLGARVIKIEAPEAGDMVRYYGVDDPSVGAVMLPTLSPMFLLCNAGKESICLDLKHPASVALVKQLVAKVDVVVENFTPRVMPGLGLGYEDLRAIRPDLIMCSISGFGQEGPLANHVCNDHSAQAMGGMAFLSGEPDGYPSLAYNGIADTVTAVMAAMSINAALFHRAGTGQGQHIDISMMDTVMSVDSSAAPYYAASQGQYSVERSPRAHFLLSPAGVFKGPEGRYFAMLVDWGRLCHVMGHPELIDDPEFATNQARLRNKDRVHAVIESFLQSFATAEAAFQALVDGRIPAGPVLDPWEAQNHPQMACRKMVREVPYPAGPSLPTIATAPHFSKTPITVGRAPFIGEHNALVLGELLDLNEAELHDLYRTGALYQDAAARHLAGE